MTAHLAAIIQGATLLALSGVMGFVVLPAAMETATHELPEALDDSTPDTWGRNLITGEGHQPQRMLGEVLR